MAYTIARDVCERLMTESARAAEPSDAEIEEARHSFAFHLRLLVARGHVRYTGDG
jgi:hypothetical protein